MVCGLRLRLRHRCFAAIFAYLPKKIASLFVETFTAHLIFFLLLFSCSDRKNLKDLLNLLFRSSTSLAPFASSFGRHSCFRLGQEFLNGVAAETLLRGRRPSASVHGRPEEAMIYSQIPSNNAIEFSSLHTTSTDAAVEASFS